MAAATASTRLLGRWCLLRGSTSGSDQWGELPLLGEEVVLLSRRFISIPLQLSALLCKKESDLNNTETAQRSLVREV